MNKDINDDPIFNELKKFAKQSTGPEFMPAEFYEAFRNSKRSKLRSKSFIGTAIGLFVASIALPSLSYAHVLPSPIANVVERVVHVISAPVRALVGTNSPAPQANVVATPSPTDPATSPAATATQTPSTVAAPTPHQVVAPTPSAVPRPAPAPHTDLPAPVISNPGNGENHNENEGSNGEVKSESEHNNSGEDEGSTFNSNSNKTPGAQTHTSKPEVGGSKESEHKSSSNSDLGDSEN